MVNKKVIQEYLEGGKELTLLNGKIPIIKNWTEKKCSEKQIYQHKGNLGWVLSKEDLVIDVDPRNGGEQSFKKLESRILKLEPKTSLEPTIKTPSGGFHIYLKKPKAFIGKELQGKLNDYPGIDFLSKGRQCLILSSKIGDKNYEFYDDFLSSINENRVAPESLVEMILATNKSKLKNESISKHIVKFDNVETDKELDFEDGLIKFNDVSEERILQVLDDLDPSMEYGSWLNVGMSLYNWNPSEDEGLRVWEKWSKGGENYQSGETAKKWKTFSPNGTTTVATLFYMQKLANVSKQTSEIEDWIRKIRLSDENQLKVSVFPKIKKLEIDYVNREKLAKAIQGRFFELTGARLPIGKIRSEISQSENTAAYWHDKKDIPKWCEEWVYVNSHNAYLNLNTLEIHKEASFNIENGYMVPTNEGGGKNSASKHCADNGFIQKVSTIVYLPTEKDKIFYINDRKVVNIFNHDSLPAAATSYTNAGKDYIERIKKHFKFLCTTEENAELLMSWVAHNVQYPGKKILWSPLIISIQGIGKSYLGAIFKHCLGHENVGVISPSQITSSFNGWMTGKAVLICEEVRIAGHNRYEVTNSLKQLITDKSIMINQKGVNQFETINTANPIFFSNNVDALPIEKDDRRYWPLKVQLTALSNLIDFVGEPASTYFPALFKGLDLYGDQVLKFFKEYEISKELLEANQAPMTEFKKAMIATEESKLEGIDEVKELIVRGGDYYNEHVISISDLFEDILFEFPQVLINTRRKNSILTRLGYMKHPERIKVDGKLRTFYTKNTLSSSEVKLFCKGIELLPDS